MSTETYRATHNKLHIAWERITAEQRHLWLVVAQFAPQSIGAKLADAAGLRSEDRRTLHELGLVEYGDRGSIRMSTQVAAFAEQASDEFERSIARNSYMGGCSQFVQWSCEDPPARASNFVEGYPHLRKACGLTSVPQFASFHAKIGRMLQTAGLLTEARGALRRAISIQTKVYAGHAGLAALRSRLAIVEQCLDDLYTARALTTKSIFVERDPSEDDFTSFTIRYSDTDCLGPTFGRGELTLTKVTIDDLVSAHELLSEVVSLQESIREPGHPDLAILYSNLATVEQVLRNSGSHRESLTRTRSARKND